MKKIFQIFLLITIFSAISFSSEIHMKDWTRQWGDGGSDYGKGVAIDTSTGDIYVTGYPGILLSKYNSVGVEQWTQTLAVDALAQAVTTDNSGNIYVTGEGNGDLDGNISSGGIDIFLTKYNSSGVKQWTKQWGTPDTDQGYGVAVDTAGYIYITGITNGDLDGNTSLGLSDIFLTKYDSDGTKQWSKQWGTSLGDIGFSIVSDSSSNIYITGQVHAELDGNTALGNSDFFIIKCNSSGVKEWSKQWGTNDADTGYGVAVDTAGYIYVVGDTYGNLDGVNAGFADIVLTKYNSSGVQQWTKQWGTSASDIGKGVAIDKATGNIYVTGYTNGNLDGNINPWPSSGDAILTKYNAAGEKQWTKQWGSTDPIAADSDYGYSVAVSTSGNVYVTGGTQGDLDGALTGTSDFFLTKWEINYSPTLAWTEETNYTSDGLNPEAGSPNTNFVFRTKYTDSDDDAPNSGYPKIHIKKGGSEISGSPFAMAETDAGDTTYTDGKLYTYSKVLVSTGTDYTYYFEAQDSYNTEATGTPISETDAPDVSLFSMNEGRYIHTATSLSNGKVLAVGGWTNSVALASAELYDPSAGTFTPINSMITARRFHTATLLPNGKILIVGGENGAGTTFSAAELYDPNTGSFATTGSMSTVRTNFTATLLPNGKVLVAGGYGESGTLSSAELYDPNSGTFSATGSMNAIRQQYTATLLPNGKVLISGGWNDSVALSSAELYDPNTGTFTATGSMSTTRELHTSILLPNGKVLVVGGYSGSTTLSSSELYDPNTGTFAATGSLNAARYLHTATLLLNGEVLISGGYNGSITFSSAELYDPSDGSFSTVGAMDATRQRHTATLLSSGKLLICGGYNGSTALSSAELLSIGIPPNAISDLTAVSPSAGNINLSWTSPGEDGNIGTLNNSTFTIQYSSSAEDAVNELFWSTASAQVLLSTTGVTPETTRYLELTDLLANTTYYLRAWTKDVNGNYSPLSNGATILTMIETPTSIFFDEVSASTIIASAYAPTGFSRLETGLSGVVVAKDNAYASWRNGNIWTEKADMPSGRYYLGGAAYNGKIYAMGGVSSGVTYNRNDEYDPITNTWTTKTTMQLGRHSLSTVLLGNKIFAIGGLNQEGNYQDINNSYDPISDSWTTTNAVMSSRNSSFGAASFNARIYTFGGLDGQPGKVNRNISYSVGTDIWTTHANLPTARYTPVAVTVNGKIYVIGGQDANGYSPKNEEYDPILDSWETKSPLPTPRNALAAAMVGGKIYVIGGQKSGDGLGMDVNEEYDPLSDTWQTRALMPTPREHHIAVALNGKIYAIGGMLSINKNEVYDPGVSQVYTELTPNTQYTFKAKARNSLGIETSESIEISTYTLAMIPTTSGQGINNVYATSATVNWLANGNPADTTLYRTEAALSASFTSIESSSYTYNANATIGGLTPNTTYHFRVAAINGSSIQTDYLYIGSTITAPAIPSNSEVSSIETTQFSITWSTNTNPSTTLYEAQISTNDFFTIYSSSNTLLTSATFYSLLPNYSHKIRIHSINSIGIESSYLLHSDTPTYTLAMIPATSPQGISDVYLTSATVNWLSNDNHSTTTLYRTEAALSASFTSIESSSDTYNTNATIAGLLSPSSTYYLRVSAINSNSVQTDYLYIGSTTTPPSTPANLEATGIETTQLSITWSANGNQTDTTYEVQLSTNDFSTIYSSSNTLLTSTTVYSLLPNYPHKIRIRSVDTIGGESSYVLLSDTPTYTLAMIPAISTPGITNVYATSTTVNWLANGNPSNTLYEAQISTNDFSTIYSSSNTLLNFTTFYGLLPNYPYKIRIRSENHIGTESSYLLYKDTPTWTLANPPTGTNASAIYISSAIVNWDSNSNPSYTLSELQYSTSSSVFDDNFTSSTTSHTSTNLLACTSYYFRIKNYNQESTATVFDSTLEVFINGPGPVYPPGNLTAVSLTGNAIKLTWDPSPSEETTHYRLFYDSGTGTVDYLNPIAILTSTETTYTTDVLASSSSYKFTLRAYTTCGVPELNTHVLASASSTDTLSGIRTAIKIPQSGKKVSGNRVTVMAEPISGEISQIQKVTFQYKASTSTIWTDILAANINHLNPDTDSPYFVHWDLTTLAQTNYDLRAVATDTGNNTDSTPPAITISADTVDPDISESSLGGGQVKKQQRIYNTVSNTIQTADEASTQLTKVELPAEALNISTVSISVTNNPVSFPSVPDGVDTSGLITEVSLSNSQTILSNGKSASITLSYEDTNNDGIVDGTTVRADKLEMYSAETLAGPWKKDIVSTRDRSNKTVRGQTTHFSFFALFATLASTLDNINVYPNPFKPNDNNSDTGIAYAFGNLNSGILFDNLPASVDIKIYTVTGQLVAKFGSTASSGKIQWDVKNDSGKDVASGIYIAVISSPGQETIVRKVAVIR
ncbi:MAG: SBBP repeat-containing protein [Candidatus Omnitrophica bacterium]|nr:SBBP repeat-containing protein [Candidatus Omnitrophota bacterium]